MANLLLCTESVLGVLKTRIRKGNETKVAHEKGQKNNGLDRWPHKKKCLSPAEGISFAVFFMYYGFRRH